MVRSIRLRGASSPAFFLLCYAATSIERVEWWAQSGRPRWRVPVSGVTTITAVTAVQLQRSEDMTTGNETTQEGIASGVLAEPQSNAVRLFGLRLAEKKRYRYIYGLVNSFTH